MREKEDRRMIEVRKMLIESYIKHGVIKEESTKGNSIYCKKDMNIIAQLAKNPKEMIK